MRSSLILAACVLAAVFAVPGAARAVEIGLTVSDDAGRARKPGTVTAGVPFSKGTVRDVRKLSVSAGGKVVPAQFTKLVNWEDGSVRWALLDTQLEIDAGGKAPIVVRDDGKNRAPASPVKVDDSAAEVRMSTGSLRLIISRTKPGLLQSLTVDGTEKVTSAGRGPVIYAVGEARKVPKKYGRRTYTTTEYGPGKEVPAAPPHEVVVEQAGPLRAVVRARGRFPSLHSGMLSYTARISVFAGQKFVKVHFWLENNGAMGYYSGTKSSTPKGKAEWFIFDGMALELGMGGAPKAGCEGSPPSPDFKLLQRCLRSKDKARLKWNYQPIYQFSDLEYTISAGGKLLKKGVRTDGLVELSGSAGGGTVAVRDFWQNYEKAIELKDSKLRLWLWPTEGAWPRPQYYANSSFFDKQLTEIYRHVHGGNSRMLNASGPGIYYLQGGTHKGHEFILDFSGRPAEESHAELTRPLFALASAEHYAASGAAPALFAPPETRTDEEECNEKLDAWMRSTMSVVDPKSKNGLVAARKDSPWNAGGCTYWYGWMDFGDIANPAHGPSGLTGDWLLVMMLNAMRTGNLGFLRTGSEMARHRVDIDQLWSDRDPPRLNGLQRAGGYSTFHCFRLWRPPGVATNHLAGTALYYMLTGEPKALEACRRNAEGLKRGWTHIARAKPWMGPQDNMAANAFAIHSYLAMHDLTADGKWIAEALKLFRTNVVGKWKKLGPHLHSRQQIGSQSYRKDDIKYCQGIYALCLLHHYTGDKKTLELLKAGADRDFPENFFDAPLYLADLHAYVALVSGKSEYADDATEHWIEASPESKCPPIYLGKSNSIWPGRAVMYLRTGNLLQYYFWKRGARGPGARSAKRSR